MDEPGAERVRRLQERIHDALRETAGEGTYSSFSPYMPDHWQQLTRRMTEAALPGGAEGVEAALDVFDELAPAEDSRRLRHALLVFLTHHPAVGRLGLDLPSLEERSPSRVLPSGRGGAR